MAYEYDIDQIKENLEINQIADIVAEMGGEPVQKSDTLICKTICHHGESHKLYYYDNSHLFKCYTDCGDSFDIFELAKRSQNFSGLPQAITYVAKYFNIAGKDKEGFKSTIQEYLTKLENYDRIKDINVNTQVVELKSYDDKFLKNFPKPILTPWMEDNISQAAIDRFEIAYDPKNQAIVIPHRDINGRLV